jgi:hypothetical protein
MDGNMSGEPVSKQAPSTLGYKDEEFTSNFNIDENGSIY